MKKYALLFAAALFAGTACAADDAAGETQSPEDLCAAYAQEDGISQEEMKGYMESCLKSLDNADQLDAGDTMPEETAPVE